MSTKFSDPSELLEKELAESVRLEDPIGDQVEEVSPTEKRRLDGLAVFASLGLSEFDIKEAKAKFKRVYSFIFDEDNAFLYKALNKRDFDNIVALAKGDEEKFKSLIVRTGTIWPSVTTEYLGEKPAGISKLLFELVMAQSGFVDIGLALQSVIEL
jgi:hypothetical protein